jgi:hypothetical protein
MFCFDASNIHYLTPIPGRDIMAARATSTKAKAAPVEEPDEDEFEDIEDETADEDLEDLEELEEEAEEEEAPAKPKRTTKATAAKAATAPKFGSAELAAYITESTGEKYDGRGIRMLLRKLAKDGKLDRQVGEPRDRYSFTGPNDPTVKQVLAMVKSGEAKAMKQAGLQAVKDKAEAKKAAAKAAKEAEVENAEEVAEEAPRPRRTRAAAAKPAAPAKATPARRTRASS